MKEKINQFAKGIFEYRVPSVEVHPQDILLSVDAGESCSGSFVISNSEKRIMKGIVSTDCHQLILHQEGFRGEVNEISYTFQAKYCSPGEVIKGNIRIISDCQSVLLPFSVTVNVPSCTVSTGRIRDLVQFSQLAKENPQEAVRLFGSPRFEEVFLAREPHYKELYRGLSKGQDTGLALEEFLIAVHKKVPVQLSVEKQSLHYAECSDTFQERITLQKNTWGICEYKIQSDAGFVEPERQQIRTTDFVGNTYELSFVVHPDRMLAGRNFARLTISNISQTISIEIVAEKKECQSEAVEVRLRQQENVVQFYQNFLDFYRGRLDVYEYSTSVERIICLLDQLAGNDGRYSWLSQVFRVHLAIVQHREDHVVLGMEQWKENLDTLWETQPLLYGCYYYLLALWKQRDAVTTDCVQKLRECYLSREHHWLILWFLIQLDEDYHSARKRQEDILEQLRSGCHSPVIYLELCKVYNESPELLLELDAAREQCLHWGCSQGCLNQESKFRYTYLISRQKNYSKLLLEDLCTIYRTDPSVDVLNMICRMLMRGRRVLPEDREWYALGIEKNIKLTDLYEHYMYAVEDFNEIELPQKVLLYFTYNNHLNASKRAMLYAYVIRHKEQDRATYDAYCPAMKDFAFQQMAEGRVHPALSVLYEEFITEESLNEVLAQKLPSALFAREITCYHSDIVGVYVRHSEWKKEEFVPLVQGKAVVSVFTENARIFLADAAGNRYVQSVDYTSDQLVHLDYLAQKCLEYTGQNEKLALFLYQKADSMHQTGEHVIELRKRVVDISQLSDEYREKVFFALVRHYYEHFEGELLDYQLEHMSWEQVAASDRNQLVEYCAVRHCREKAMEGIMEFGYEKIEAKRLLQISSKTFADSLEKEDAGLVKLGWFIFRKGQFDENIIRYLSNYFNGTVQEMVQIWNVADGFGIDVQDFSERILAQIVFTEEIIPKAYEVFYQYYDKGFHKKLIRAFLKMTAYKYLVKGWDIPLEMFDYFYKEVRVEENRPCLLAVLKHLSRKDMLTGEETVFVDYNIHQLYEKNIILGFYKDFYGKVSLPDRIMKEQYVEYIADPAQEVKIHYSIQSSDGEGEQITESMHNVFEGIHVKGFVLFRDETLQYWISESTSEENEQQEKVRTVSCEENKADEEGTNWYHMLNHMMLLEQEEDSVLPEVMEEYAQKREAVKLLIKPLKESGALERDSLTH